LVLPRYLTKFGHISRSISGLIISLYTFNSYSKPLISSITDLVKVSRVFSGSMNNFKKAFFTGTPSYVVPSLKVKNHVSVGDAES